RGRSAGGARPSRGGTPRRVDPLRAGCLTALPTIWNRTQGSRLPTIVRRKRFAIKPMAAEEAVLQMELLHHDFFVFLDAESDLVCVLYRRQDGNYGLLEVDA
ncbi:MAG: hypothetical protein FJX77_01080, partial [Armatimonadetes bacterium]|nr:hypothetical protein [Armatimonadota bacterium]